MFLGPPERQKRCAAHMSGVNTLLILAVIADLAAYVSDWYQAVELAINASKYYLAIARNDIGRNS
ncbi:hypothetical membrane protein [Glutamicibacter arilaitensis Re117]|uniref:Hypothetical membrane protein n=1 Tax=Glutamicibacter arilaitensis (strain DSM 16368 / CIP 108037 / IAM 15318 / JCM 13566 / NCIMB 14258 / Re117) TaxID=861360 RepID=A0ABP1U7E0_GLUAR|nr:hypothetical membrane protein [Glutamicibacter arilaitensis Re117]